jgi:hypothetical protein
VLPINAENDSQQRQPAPPLGFIWTSGLFDSPPTNPNHLSTFSYFLYWLPTYAETKSTGSFAEEKNEVKASGSDFDHIASA